MTASSFSDSVCPPVAHLDKRVASRHGLRSAPRSVGLSKKLRRSHALPPPQARRLSRGRRAAPIPQAAAIPRAAPILGAAAIPRAEAA